MIVAAIEVCLRFGYTDALLTGFESLGYLGLVGPFVIGLLWVLAQFGESEPAPRSLQPGRARPPGPSYLTDYPYVSLSRAAVTRIYRTLAQFAHCRGSVDPRDRALLRSFRSRFQVAPQVAARVELEARHEGEPEIGASEPEQELLDSLLNGLVASRESLSLGEGMFMARYRRARRRARRGEPGIELRRHTRRGEPGIELRLRQRERPAIELHGLRSEGPHVNGRCACCHDALTGEVQSCRGCGTWVHPACLSELSVGGVCPTPGCSGSGWSRAEHVVLSPPPPPPPPPLPPLPTAPDPLPELSSSGATEPARDDSFAWLLDRPELLERVWSEGAFQRLLMPASPSGVAPCRCADCHQLSPEGGSREPGTWNSCGQRAGRERRAPQLS